MSSRGTACGFWTTVDCDATTPLSAPEGNEPESGLELYRGRFLEGLSLRAWGSELEEWVLQTREFIAGHVQQALLNLAEREASRGEFQQAGKKAERTHLLAGAPALEPHDLQRLLTLLLAGGSLRAGEVRREALDFDLSLAASEAEARDRLRTLHREDDQHTSSNLPPQRNAFVGRELELTEITELLLHPHSPLLSLVGAGGVGKTRLALEVARELLAGGGFADGVVFVSLEALSDASSVPAAVAAVLGLDLSGQEDAGSMVKRFLSEKRLLLVLDNFEQVLEGAAFVRELLDACPQLTLLITSWERLNLDMESVFAIEGLAYPEPATPLERAGYFGAVQLFLQRARRAEHGFSLTPDTLPAVLRICQLVEGMPLALELAASWLRALPMDDIVRELEGSIDLLESPARDVRERRRSVRAVFDHSWALLQARERDVLRGLSVFRGGFRRQAAAEIAAATLPVLASLVDKSLLRMNPEGRYDRHPLLFQYAREKLAERPKALAVTQKKYGLYFFWYLQAHAQELHSVKYKQARALLDTELPNIQAAWEWAIDRQWHEQLKDAAYDFSRLYRARRREGLELFSRAVAGLDEANPEHQAALGYALVGRASFEDWATEEVRSTLERALELLRPLDEKPGMAWALFNLGPQAGYFLRDAEKAQGYLDEGLVLARSAGVPNPIASIVHERYVQKA